MIVDCDLRSLLIWGWIGLRLRAELGGLRRPAPLFPRQLQDQHHSDESSRP